jgi:hypothetical protein
MLQSLGLTRTEFVDRMSEVFFPGTPVDLVVATKRTADPQSVSNQAASQIPDSTTSTDAEEGLLAVQETRFYRIPRSRLGAERLEILDQLYITDGKAYVSITFLKKNTPYPRLPSY